MRHYEIVVMVHPDQSEQIGQMIDRYKKLITEFDGIIHRFEDCGRRQLAYPIDKLHKAHYLVINIESNNKLLSELNSNFKFNDAVLRTLVINKKHAVTETSALFRDKDKKNERVIEAKY
jgi:small subunit ribosomal protein S6